MTAFMSQIINKYQGVASKDVISAVKNAAAKTGADFSFLMEKASAESSFNPKAKSKSSSATGLFQFIESTWLNMVKEHGAKYGLGKLAAHIQTKDGKPCVNDCRIKEQILNLRKDPKISALMAGEFAENNKDYLEKHTNGEVGTTELYLAHFLGAGGAGKFLNARTEKGNAIAAHLFPKEARANKNIFYNQDTGRPRTVNQIYDYFSKKFNGGAPTTLPAISSQVQIAHMSPTNIAPVQPELSSMSLEMAQAYIPMEYLPPVSHGIIWDTNDSDSLENGFSRVHKISVDNILLMAEMNQRKAHELKDKPVYNS